MAKQLGAAIEDARHRKRWQKQELARRVGVSQSQIGRYEAGTQNPRLPVYRRLLEVLEVPETERPQWDQWWLAGEERVPEVAPAGSPFREAALADAGGAGRAGGGGAGRSPTGAGELAGSPDPDARWRAKIERVLARILAEIEHLKADLPHRVTPPPDPADNRPYRALTSLSLIRQVSARIRKWLLQGSIGLTDAATVRPYHTSRAMAMTTLAAVR